ncbi:MAG: hypothetical protein HKM06_01600 [Spirochaetales bacterium]|nr:hypothetical protein [Spirochaetales bacterium]
MKKSLLTCLFSFLVLSILPSSAWAETQAYLYDHRLPGDRSLTLEIGPTFPLFFQQFSGPTASTNLSVGANLGLDIDIYMTENFRLGGELRGIAAVSPNNNVLFMVPLTFKATYDFNFSPFTVPVGLGAGACFTNYLSATNIEPILTPSVGAYWNVNSSWSVGLNLDYLLDFQLYFGNPIPSSESRIGNFLETDASAIYHF